MIKTMWEKICYSVSLYKMNYYSPPNQILIQILCEEIDKLETRIRNLEDNVYGIHSPCIQYIPTEEISSTEDTFKP